MSFTNPTPFQAPRASACAATRALSAASTAVAKPKLQIGRAHV